MRPIRETIPLDEAIAVVNGTGHAIDRTDTVPLDEAVGRVIARDVVAPQDVPPFDRAAMDGYAVIAEDTFGASRFDPRILRMVETVFTGQVPTRTVGRGECIEIATGAPLPGGADAVAELVERSLDTSPLQFWNWHLEFVARRCCLTITNEPRGAAT